MSSKIKVLHVDDSQDFLDFFRVIFNEWIEITSVNNPKLVVDFLRENTFDAIITDYEMPEMDGIELLTEVKKEFPDMPVIFYTGQGNEEIARKAFLAGVSDYFVKNLNEFLHRERFLNSIRQAIEKKKAEIAFRESERKYKFLYDESQSIIILMDQEGNIIDANKACLRLMECTKEELIGTSAFEHVLPEEREAVTDSYVNDMMGIWTQSLLMNVVSYKNRVRKVLFGEGAAVLTDEKGNPQAAIVAGIDITDFKATEKQLLEEREYMNAKINELNDFMFVTGSSLKPRSQSLREELDKLKQNPDELNRLLDSLIEQSEQIQYITEKLLVMANIDLNIFKKEPINLETIIQELLKTKCTENDADFEFLAALPIIHADKESLTRTFINIIDYIFINAGDLDRKLEIEIDTINVTDGLTIRIKDNGSGIEREKLGKIFNPGFALKNGNHSFGLVIARKIIEAHGGSMRAASKGKDKGTEYYITFPEAVISH